MSLVRLSRLLLLGALIFSMTGLAGQSQLGTLQAARISPAESGPAISGGLSLLDGTTTRVSVAADGAEANGLSSGPEISANGRYVAFDSTAPNLVEGDTNGNQDTFVHDRQTGETTRVSVASDGTQANANVGVPALSADGRFIAFQSMASNLVEGDTNGKWDIFVHDRQTGETTRVSVSSRGGEANSDSFRTAISADGRFVGFWSFASNLVENDINDAVDVFVHDRQTEETTLVSVASDGTQGNRDSLFPALSATGRFVAFTSIASNLVESDINNWGDIFVHDRQTGETTLVSVASDGTQTNRDSWSPSISWDGRYISFSSDATNLVEIDTRAWKNVFVHDRQTGETVLASIGLDGAASNHQSDHSTLSGNGRYVAFNSAASNLVEGDTNNKGDIFVRNLAAGATIRVSVSSAGAQANGNSVFSALSADGWHVAFESEASNLVEDDTNGTQDLFVRSASIEETLLPLVQR